jgi:2-oxoisovalerate dehydrogenase E2 component (dihydrolipoyl transacylase)
VSQYVFKLPDLGEGTVEAEIVGWRVKPGDVVAEDDVIVEVMTDKAAVEVPAPVSGRVVSTTGAAGDMVPVGAALIVFETDVEAGAGAATASAPVAQAKAAETPVKATAPAKVADTAVAKSAKVSDSAAATKRDVTPSANRPANVAAIASANAGNGVDPSRANGHREGARVATSPAIRRRAHEAGVDLKMVEGSGPNGRIVRQDFDAYVQKSVAKGGGASLRPRAADAVSSAGDTEEIKVIGLRRLIAQRMSEAKRNIPHFAYVEEIDVTELETLRRHLNSRLAPGTAALSYLPFLALALVRVLKEFPQANALYDGERGVIIRHRSVHIGVATQTPEGLKVPVVRDAQARSLWDLAAEMRRVSEAARTNKATRDELTGSTITITSLGKLGGIASTPIINAPEVAIIGVNRAVERPVVLDGAITIRRMMNLSSSFDHRFVDGYDAAALIQALKERLEHPATIFIDAP